MPAPSHGLELGDRVDIKRYGVATVVSVDSTLGEHHGRVQVQYFDRSTYWVRPSKCRKLYPVSKDSDQVGITTAMLSARSMAVVGVDIAPQPVADARARFPHCRFEVCDGFNTDLLAKLSPAPNGGYDKCFVDVGGIAPLPLVLSMVGNLQQAFKTAKIIVKSIHFARFLSSAGVMQYDASKSWPVPIKTMVTPNHANQEL
ncbi:hypothetical protein QJQ45_020962 [Haematococcus lacustris]|nr:hypothetical protein QJQ45_020962 [Haematococcus lacustris]